MTTETIKFMEATAGLTVRDLAESVKFYQSVLKMNILYSNEAYAVLRREDAGLHLTTNNKEKAAGLGYCTIHVLGVDAIYTAVIAQNATIVRTIEDSPYGLRDFVMADPDGNKILVGEPINN